MGSSLPVFLRRRRVAADLISWTLAVAAVTAGIALFRGHRLRSELFIALLIWLALAGAQVGAGLASGLYRGRARVASFEEVSWLSATMVCAGVTVSVAALLLAASAIGAALAAIATPLALLCALASRLLWRYRYEQRTVHRSVTSAPLIVFGAGEGGSRSYGRCCASRTARIGRLRSSTTTRASATFV